MILHFKILYLYIKSNSPVNLTRDHGLLPFQISLSSKSTSPTHSSLKSWISFYSSISIFYSLLVSLQALLICSRNALVFLKLLLPPPKLRVLKSLYLSPWNGFLHNFPVFNLTYIWMQIKLSSVILLCQYMYIDCFLYVEPFEPIKHQIQSSSKFLENITRN